MGSTKTVTDIPVETPSPLGHFLGELFLVNYDSPPRDGETVSRHVAWEHKNTDRARCHAAKDAAAATVVAGGDADQ